MPFFEILMIYFCIYASVYDARSSVYFEILMRLMDRCAKKHQWDIWSCWFSQLTHNEHKNTLIRARSFDNYVMDLFWDFSTLPLYPHPFLLPTSWSIFFFILWSVACLFIRQIELRSLYFHFYVNNNFFYLRCWIYWFSWWCWEPS